MFKKGLALIAVPLLLQAAFLGVLLKLQTDGRAQRTLATHTQDVIKEALKLARLVVELQGQTPGLVLTGSRDYARTAEARSREIPPVLARLRELVEDDPSQRRRADAISALSRDYLAWQAETQQLALTGRTAEAAGRIRTLRGRRDLDAILGRIDEFLAMEEALDVRRQGRLARTFRAQQAMIVAGGVAAFGLAGGLLWAYSRTFGRRVGVLVENARRLAEGKALAEPLPPGDEIGEIDRSFHTMARTLAERDQENEMFIYSVSHDLRSPLVNLQGFSKELALTCDDLRAELGRCELPPDRRRRLDGLLDDLPMSIHYIQNAVLRLSAIIDALLRLSRAGRVEYRRADVDMDALLARVAEALRGTAAQRGAEIRVEPLPPAHGDPTALEQVFANLLGNALNYLDPARPGRIAVGALPDGEDGAAPGLVTYAVRDNGLGVAPDHQAKLFTAFQRLHPGVAKGEGIGLALVRRVVERHGGRVWVESAEGLGSTFFVSLPRADAAEPGGSPGPAAAGR